MNFSQFLAAAHISRVNCDERAEYRPREPGLQFSSLNVDFSSPKCRPTI